MFARRVLLNVVLFSLLVPIKIHGLGAPLAPKVIDQSSIKKLTADLISTPEKIDTKELYQPEMIVPIAEQLLSECPQHIQQKGIPSYFKAVRSVVMHPLVTESVIISCAQKLLNTAQLQQINQQLSSETILDLLCHGMPSNPYDLFKLIIAFKREQLVTPTQAHFFYHLEEIVNTYAQYAYDLPALNQIGSLLKRIVAQEKIIMHEDNYSFIHAAQENIIFAMDLYTQGWFIKKEQAPVDNFLFLRFPNLNKSPLTKAASYIKHYTIEHCAVPLREHDITKLMDSQNEIQQATNTITQMGAHREDKPGIRYALARKLATFADFLGDQSPNRLYRALIAPSYLGLYCSASLLVYPKILLVLARLVNNCSVAASRLVLFKAILESKLVFMTTPFFCNVTHKLGLGAHTPFYFWQNNNCNPREWLLREENSWQHIAKRLGLEEYFDRYKNELAQLSALHKAIANEKGVIIQFSFTPAALKKHAYCASPGGPLKTITVDQTPTSDVQHILTTMRNNILAMSEKDELEFCYITANMRPGDGITMHRHYYGDQNLVQEYYQKRDALFAKIRADFNAHA